MKKIELLLLGILIPLDYLMLIIAGIIAYLLRFTHLITEFRPVIFDLPFNHFFNLLLITSFFWLIIFAINGLYQLERIKQLFKLFLQIIVASTAATMVVVIAFFFNQRLFNSRLIILIFWLLAIIFVFLGRLIHYFIYRIFYLKGIISKNAIIIGDNNDTKTLISEFKKSKKYGINIIEHFSNFDEKIQQEIVNLIKKVKIDEIIQTNTDQTAKKINDLISFCYNYHLNLRYTANLYETKLKNFEFKTIAGLPLIEIKNTPLDGWGKIFKKFFDFILALLLLIILSPIFILVALLIKIDSKGPVFVSFERIGEKGQNFKLYKFRSMIANAHLLKPQMQQLNERKNGPLFKIKNDPRVTRFGKFLRQYSIDELPQLFNVLKDEMSLVGPRPHEPEEVSRYQTYHKKLLSIKPGMTGLAAISGRSDLLFEDEAKLDTFYIENWSLLFDVIILLKTPFIIILKKSAS